MISISGVDTVKLLLLAAFAAACVALGAGVSNHLWQAKWDKHIAADERVVREAVAKAVAKERAQAKSDLDAAVKEAQAQEKIVTRTQTIIKEVPRYVTASQDRGTCVTYGLVRVLDAAALGADPADLELPAGQSDDACAPVKASALAASVAENYGTARQNAQQLDALIEDTRSRIDRFNEGVTSDPTVSP